MTDEIREITYSLTPARYMDTRVTHFDVVARYRFASGAVRNNVIDRDVSASIADEKLSEYRFGERQP